MGRTIWFQIPAVSTSVFFLQNIHIGTGNHPASYYIGTGFNYWGNSGRNLKLTTYLRLVPRLRMSGTRALLSPHAFITWIGTNLTLFVYYFTVINDLLLKNKLQLSDITSNLTVITNLYSTQQQLFTVAGMIVTFLRSRFHLPGLNG
jgi:hypothetical protein